MIVLTSLAPPASLQLGLRAICKQSQRTICAAAVRQLSTASRTSPEPCRVHGVGLFGGSSRPLRPAQSRHDRFLPRTAIRTIFKFRAIVHYSQLPDDYEDAKGLCFRKEDLSRTEVSQIFGQTITTTGANTLLRIIHGRRVAGTLDDPDLQENTVAYRAEEKIKALEYLRKYIPVDEVINAGLRAEDELRLLEEQETDGEEREIQQEEASPTKTHPGPQADPAREIPSVSGRLPQKKDESPYGESTFDRIRKRNEALNAEKERLAEEERIKREEEEALQNIGGLSKTVEAPRAISPWRQKYAERATSDLTAPPDMKNWERLLPATTFTLLVIAACLVLAAYYTPPRREWRVWPDIPPAAATCIALILVNLGVWALWKFPPAWAIFNRYMLVTPVTPRPLQLIGALFSHQSASHLAANMVVLWLVGIRLHDEIGRGNFLALYFASGTVGFLASMFNLVLVRGIQFTTLGASGAIYGLLAGYFWLHRKDEFKILGFPPEPYSSPTGAAFLGLLIGVHIWGGLFSNSVMLMRSDLASHFGGIVAGIVGIEWVRSYMAKRESTLADRRQQQQKQQQSSKVVDVTNKVVEVKPKSQT